MTLEKRCFLSNMALVFAHHAPHAGIASDTRIQFWCAHEASVDRVPQLHTALQHLVLLFWCFGLLISPLTVVVPLWASFSTSTLPGCVTVNSGSNCCSLAPLCAPCFLLMTCCTLCHSDIPQTSLSPKRTTPLAPCA